MKRETQLRKIIKNTSDEVLSEKLFNYYMNHLEDLRILIQNVPWKDPNNYECYLVYNNNSEFWKQQTDIYPSTVIEQLGETYNLKDKYVFRDCDYSFISHNSLSEFYGEYDVKETTKSILDQLRKHPVKNINNIEPEAQETLLKALK